VGSAVAAKGRRFLSAGCQGILATGARVLSTAMSLPHSRILAATGVGLDERIEGLSSKGIAGPARPMPVLRGG